MAAVGEVAELKVLLTLQDQMSAGLATAQARIKELQGAGAGGLAGLSSAASKVESAFGKVGTALSHAGSQITGLIKNVGLLGAGFGLLSGVGILKGAIDTANTMAKSIETLTALTGESATTISQLLAVFERFGVSTDTATTRLAFMEKTLGTLANNTKALTTLQKTFGISLVDSSGNIVDVNTALQRLADYMNGSASAADKAKLASTLLGRGYVDLLPVLSQGAAGIAAVESQAQSLGNTLDQTQVDQLMAYQNAMRDMGEAMQGLGLQIAVALVPELTKLAQNISSFVATNKDQIIGFFRDAGKFAEDMGHAVETQVVPAIKGIIGAWNSIPQPLRDFLVTAFVAGKVSKFLFDVNIPGALLTLGVKWAAQALAGLAGDVLGFATGGAVAAGEIEAGMAAGGATAAGEIGAATAAGGVGIAATISGLLAKIPGLIVTGAGVAIGVAASQKFLDPNRNPITGKYDPLGQKGIGHVAGGGAVNAMGAPIPSAATLAQKDADLAPALNSFTGALQTATGWIGHWTKSLQDAEKANHAALFGGPSSKQGSAADALVKYLQSLSSGYFEKPGAMSQLNKDITTLQRDQTAAIKAGNTKLAGQLGTDISQLQALKAKLDTANSKLATADAKLAAIAGKKTTFISNVYADLSVSIRSQQTNNIRSNLYGRSIAV